MLRMLLDKPGETVTALRLAGTSADGANERTVDVQINRLRRKIERDPGQPGPSADGERLGLPAGSSTRCARQARRLEVQPSASRQPIRRGDRAQLARIVAWPRILASTRRPACRKASMPALFSSSSTPVVILQAVVAYVFMEKHWQSVTARLSAATTKDISAIIELYETSPHNKETAENSSGSPSSSSTFRSSSGPERSPAAGPKPFFSILDQALSTEIHAAHFGLPFWIDTVGRSRFRRSPHQVGRCGAARASPVATRPMRRTAISSLSGWSAPPCADGRGDRCSCATRFARSNSSRRPPRSSARAGMSRISARAARGRFARPPPPSSRCGAASNAQIEQRTTMLNGVVA